VHLGQGQVDARAVGSPRNYLTANHGGNAGNPSLYAQKTLIQSQLQSQNQGNGKYYANNNGQYSLQLPSPRTTSFMPFGNNSHRGLPDYSLTSEYGTDYSPQISDDLNNFGEYTPEYKYKNEYTSNMLDPLHLYNNDHLGSNLDPQLEGDNNLYGYRHGTQQKAWENI
jgi:hypothetical protein